MKLLHGLQMEGITNAEWELAQEGIQPFSGQIRGARDVDTTDPVNGYTLPFKTACFNEQTEKSQTPTITRDGDEITVDHPDIAGVYYTTDGSYPGPGNPAATLVQASPAVFQLPAGATVLRVGFAVSYQDPSDTIMLEL